MTQKEEFDKAIEILDIIEENINICCAVTMEPDEVLELVDRLRQNTDAIKKMIAYHEDYHFKPVWDGTEENLKEIEAYRVELDIPKNKTYIMPAGDTRETLIPMYVKVFEMVAEHGYNMTGRDHIIAYDTERGV